MQISTAFPTKYISSGDLQGRDVAVNISHVDMEEVEKGEFKPILYFVGKEKGLVLNKTNASMIAQLYGDDTDGWQGHPLVLYTIHTEYQGKPVMGVRVRAGAAAKPPTPPSQTPAIPPSNGPAGAQDIDDEIPF